MPKKIKELPEHGRPREKMRDRGPAALTDEELVSAIVGMGTAGVDVRTMSHEVVALIREHREALTLDHLRVSSRHGYRREWTNSFSIRAWSSIFTL
jgi:DNA repair protein RadC